MNKRMGRFTLNDISVSYLIKTTQTPSKNGINGTRVIALSVMFGETLIALFDGTWRIKPQTKFAKKIVKYIVNGRK